MPNNVQSFIRGAEPTDGLGTIIALFGMAVMGGWVGIQEQIPIGGALLVLGVAIVFGRSTFKKVLRIILEKWGTTEKKK